MFVAPVITKKLESVPQLYASDGRIITQLLRRDGAPVQSQPLPPGYLVAPFPVLSQPMSSGQYFFKTRDHTHVCNAGIPGTTGRYFCVWTLFKPLFSRKTPNVFDYQKIWLFLVLGRCMNGSLQSSHRWSALFRRTQHRLRCLASKHLQTLYI